jgi:uncharacterized membrane protein
MFTYFQADIKIPALSKLQLNLIKYISLFATMFVAFQIAYTISKGESFCVNEGCKIVELMTTLPPMYLNVLGLCFFILVFLLTLMTSGRFIGETFLRLFLILGITGDTIAICYQIYVAKTMCIYCCFVFLFIFLLNLIAGTRQTILSAGIIASQLFFFSFFSFGSQITALGNFSIYDGTYAVKTCEKPIKRVFLLFSEDCPHCHNVLEELKNCTACEFHFNPVKEISSAILPGLSPISTYRPEINVTALNILGIKNIPVLIVENTDGLTFIKGDKKIINFIKQSCMVKNPFKIFEEDPLLNTEENGACGLEEKCSP